MKGRRVGILRLKSSGRWEIFYGKNKFGEEEVFELSSGTRVDLKILNRWIFTSIEHGKEGYYATTRGVALVPCLDVRLV
jgi:hypothetical protein